MWKKKPPKEFVEVRGKVERIGMRPFDEVCRGYRVLLEGDNSPYIIPVDIWVGKETFVELTQPGDEISFIVEKGELRGKRFVNHSLSPRLSPYM